MAPIEIIMEIQRIGSILRVYAIDAETGTEAVFQAPASTDSFDLKALAERKIRYVLRKNAKEEKVR